jgi:hypothetical protein
MSRRYGLLQYLVDLDVMIDTNRNGTILSAASPTVKEISVKDAATRDRTGDL